jgi:Zn finger protein HypA/HybF involved in hydrogenase expression
VRYVNAHTPVTIICPDHGPFSQVANEHLKKYGCPYCGGTKKLTLEQFIEKAKAVHGDRYDYSQVQYLGGKIPVTIICPDHGPFTQTPGDHHIARAGCPECAGTKKGDTKSFIENARRIHGNRYDYSLVDYVSARKLVTIICPEHGPFQQKPNHHLFKRGCPNCAVSGFKSGEPGTLYYIAITTDDGDTRYKIGITNQSVEHRFDARDRTRIRIVKTWRYAKGSAAADREAEILRKYAGDRYYGPSILKSGNTELFTHDILELDSNAD